MEKRNKNISKISLYFQTSKIHKILIYYYIYDKGKQPFRVKYASERYQNLYI